MKREIVVKKLTLHKETVRRLAGGLSREQLARVHGASNDCGPAVVPVGTEPMTLTCYMFCFTVVTCCSDV